jgi:hypothetical protein
VLFFAVVPVSLAAPGDHIRAGKTTITPSVMTGAEYHTNAFLSDGTFNQLEPGLSWVLRPKLGIDVDGSDVQLSLGGSWGLKKFFDVTPTNGLYVENLDRFNEVDASFGLVALPRSVVGIRLDDRFEIQNTPAQLESSPDIGNANIRATSNDLNGGLVIRPGSALEIGLLGNFGLDQYTVPEELLISGNDPNINNRSNYGPVVDMKWRFLPRTSFTFRGNANWLKWENNLVYALSPEVAGSPVGTFVGKPDAFKWQATAGLKGQLTEKIASTVELGYGQMYYDEQTVLDAGTGVVADATELDPNAGFAQDLTSFGEGFVVNAQLGWSPIKGQGVAAGYRKDFQDAFFTNYVTYNYFYLRYEGTFAQRLDVNAEASYRLDGFKGEVTRNDQNIRVKLNTAYRVSDWLSAGLSGGWIERACGSADCDNGEYFASQYDDFYGTVGMTFTY